MKSECLKELKRIIVERKVEGYADIFFKSEESFFDTCQKYQLNFEEIVSSFSELLPVINHAKYQALCQKYPILLEKELEKKLGKVRK